MLALGLASGLVSSVLFNVGIALQALEAKSTQADEGLRVSLLARLLRRPRWLAGLLLGGLGVVFEAIAFANAPFVVVEPLLAAGLLVLLAIGVREMGERPGPATVVGVLAIIAGTALIAWGAPAHSEQHRGPVTVVVVMAALVAVSLVPFALRRSRFDTALGVVAWAAVAAFAGIGATISGMTALQRRPATTVVPISTAVQTFLPIALEPLFLTENWRQAQLDGLVLVAGLVVMAIGTVLVARMPAVSALAAAGASFPEGLGQQFFGLLLGVFDAFFDLLFGFFGLLLGVVVAAFELFFRFFDALFGRFLAFFDAFFSRFGAFFDAFFRLFATFLDAFFGRFDALFGFLLGAAG